MSNLFISTIELLRAGIKPNVSSEYVHHLLLSRGVPIILCAA